MSYHNILNWHDTTLIGYENYYSFALYYEKIITSVEYWLRGLCTKLLAAKFKFKTIVEVMKLFFKYL